METCNLLYLFFLVRIAYFICRWWVPFSLTPPSAPLMAVVCSHVHCSLLFAICLSIVYKGYIMKYIAAALIFLAMLLMPKSVSAIASPVFTFNSPMEEQKVRMAIVAACYNNGWELGTCGKDYILATLKEYEICIPYNTKYFRINYTGYDELLYNNPELKEEYVREVNQLLHSIDKELN